jgi:cell wall-associated NlpC family hydrolase
MTIRPFVAAAAIAALCVAAPAALANEKVVLGQIGKVLQPTSVFTQPDPTSKTWFNVQPDALLCVKTDAPKGWIKVLLNTGRYGYVPAEAILPMNYEVTGPSKPVRSSAAMTASRGSASARAVAADRGLDFIGTPYVWGGNDINNGIDCSAFVQKLFGGIGVNLPRTAAEQALVGKPITRLEELQKGDRLYFFDKSRGKIGHTGLYLGDCKFVHSSSNHKGVNVDDLRSGHWLKILVAARR